MAILPALYFVSLCTIALGSLQQTPSILILSGVGFALHGVYLIDRLKPSDLLVPPSLDPAGAHSSRLRRLTGARRLLRVWAAFSLIWGTWLLASAGWPLLAFGPIGLLMVLMYNLPILGNRRIRNHPITKPLFVTAAAAGIVWTAILGSTESESLYRLPSPGEWTTVLSLAFFAGLDSTCCDLRDVRIDQQSGGSTLAIRLGPRALVVLCAGLGLAVSLIAWVSHQTILAGACSALALTIPACMLWGLRWSAGGIECRAILVAVALVVSQSLA